MIVLTTGQVQVEGMPQDFTCMREVTMASCTFNKQNSSYTKWNSQSGTKTPKSFLFIRL